MIAPAKMASIRAGLKCVARTVPFGQLIRFVQAAQNNIAAVSAPFDELRRLHDLRLNSPPELLVQTLLVSLSNSNCIQHADRFASAFRGACEGAQLVARSLQSIGDRAAFQPPFGNERLALHRAYLLRAGVDHLVVIMTPSERLAPERVRADREGCEVRMPIRVTTRSPRRRSRFNCVHRCAVSFPRFGDYPDDRPETLRQNKSATASVSEGGV